jgi:hypothetical protein
MAAGLIAGSAAIPDAIGGATKDDTWGHEALPYSIVVLEAYLGTYGTAAIVKGSQNRGYGGLVCGGYRVLD